MSGGVGGSGLNRFLSRFATVSSGNYSPIHAFFWWVTTQVGIGRKTGYTGDMGKKVDILRTVDRETLIDLLRTHVEQNRALQAQVEALQKQVEKLERQLAKNSTNSSKPPSSDGLTKPKRKQKSQRKKGQRKTGGQPGHEGHMLKAVAVPDEIVRHRLDVCPQCEQDLSAIETQRLVKRQVFDIPPIQRQVREHQAEVKICPCCGETSRAQFPEAVKAPTQYGPNILAQAVYLNTYQLIPLARVREWFSDCIGQPVSEGTVQRAVAIFSDSIGSSLDEIYKQLTESGVVHLDETGFRVNGVLAWLHTVCTEVLSYYTVHVSRGDDAIMDAGVLPNCSGFAVHDGLVQYMGYEMVEHALCNAHHLRELQLFVDEFQAEWASGLQDLLREMKKASEDPDTSAALIAKLEQRYDTLVEAGLEVFPVLPRPPNHKGRFEQHPATNLLGRLRDNKAAVLAFLHHPDVPFDNNQAERDLRMMKVKQKISGGFRTWTGAEHFAAVRTYLMTARKHGVSMLKATHMALVGTPFIPDPALPE